MWTGMTTVQVRDCIKIIQKHDAKCLFATQGTVFISEEGNNPTVMKKELEAHGAKEVVFIKE